MNPSLNHSSRVSPVHKRRAGCLQRSDAGAAGNLLGSRSFPCVFVSKRYVLLVWLIVSAVWIWAADQSQSPKTVGTPPIRPEDESGRPELVLRRGHGNSIRALAMSNDASHLLSASFDGRAILWDVATFQPHYLPADHSDNIADVAISPDGSKLLAGMSTGGAVIWNRETGNEELTLGERPGYVGTVAFHPNGQTVLLAEGQQGATLWDANTGIEIRAFKDEYSYTRTAAFCDQGRQVAVAAASGIVVWDTASGEQVKLIEDTSLLQNPALKFSEDGTRLVVAKQDEARIWDVVAEQQLLAFPIENRPMDAAVSPDRQYVAIGFMNGTAAVWDISTGEKVHTWDDLNGAVAAVEFSPDSRCLLTGDQFDVHQWDIASGKRKRSFKGSAEVVSHAAFTSGGKQFVVTSSDKQVTIWDATDGQPKASFDCGNAMPSHVAFSPDDRRMLTVSHMGGVRVWDAATGAKLPAPSIEDADYFVSAEWSRDGDSILVCTSSGVFLCAGAEFAEVRKLDSTERHSCACFGHDGKRVFAATHKVVAVWDVATGKRLSEIAQTCCYKMAVSSDGKWLAAVSYEDNKQVVVWNLQSVQPAFVLQGHSKMVSDLAFAPDSKHLLTCSMDGTAQIWDIDRPCRVRTLWGHEDSIWSAVYRPDGERILTASSDGTTRLWDAESGEEIGRFILIRDVDDWLTWTRDGFYVATSAAEKIATWQLDGKMIDGEEYAEQYHKPDQVAAILQNGEPLPPEPLPPRNPDGKNPAAWAYRRIQANRSR